MAARFVAKAFISNAGIKYRVLDCLKDEWATHRLENRYHVFEEYPRTFDHQESAQYAADKLNAEESENGE